MRQIFLYCGHKDKIYDKQKKKCLENADFVLFRKLTATAMFVGMDYIIISQRGDHKTGYSFSMDRCNCGQSSTERAALWVIFSCNVAKPASVFISVYSESF